MRMVLFLVLVLCAAAARADAPPRETFAFSFTQSSMWGQSVWVMGNLPELGNGDVRHAVKLLPTSYPTWTIDVSLPIDTTFSYQFFLALDTENSIENAANFTPISGVLVGSTLGPIADPAAKTIIADLTMTAPQMLYRQPPGTGPYTPASMWPIGPGPSGGAEQRFAIKGIGIGQRPIEFYFLETGGGLRVPSTGSFTADNDRVLVRNLNVYTYPPAAVVNNSFKNYNPSSLPWIFCPALNESFAYRVVLPRGYNNHPTRRYPVLYMHDGQNVFDIGAFGTWNADESAAELTRLGQMREIIMVGIDNTSNRIRDYIAPDDIVPIGPGAGSPGRADDYAEFVINHLKPVIDATYRTLPDRDNTGILGSSLGGVASLYFAWDYPATFGRCAPFSGSWWLDNFPARVASQPKRDLRIYLDVGTDDDGYADSIALRDDLVTKPYTLEDELRFRVGTFQAHNEAAWADRLPEALTFLFPGRESPDELGSINTARKGDVDNDGDEDVDDLYAFERGNGVNMDVTRDGTPSGAADRAELRNILRATELADMTASRGEVTLD